MNSGHVLKVIRPEDSAHGRKPVVDPAVVELTEVDRMRGYVLECVDMCFAATGAESKASFAGAVPMQLTKLGTGAGAAAASEVYVFNGQKLIESQEAEPVYEEEEERVYYADEDDCECCNITACLVPELRRTQKEPQEEVYYEDCTFIGYFVPELDPNMY